MRRTVKIIFLSMGFMLFFLSSVMAAEAVDDLSLAALLNMDLESAGFFKIEAAKAPVYTTVIGEETIHNAPAIKLKDLYELYVPGMSVVFCQRSDDGS